MSPDLFDISDARIDVADVRSGGFDTELSDDELAEYIATANGVVNDELMGKGMDDTRLARIELYLTRHFVLFMPEPQLSDEGVGPASRNYTGDFAHQDLKATRPGQQALMLDKSNTLGTREFDQFFTLG